jgi:Calx-beta domain/FG-GAP-like repeat
MSFHSWLRNLRSTLAPGRGQRHHGRRGSLRAATHRLNLEVLEDRRTPSFSPVASFPVDTSPRAVATADFNNDSRLDLATTNYDGTVSVLLGDGQGGFGAASQFTALSIGSSLAVGDFNNDGNLDVATIGNQLSVLLSDGDGTFRPPVNIGLVTNGSPLSMAVGDFNSDGNTDLVYTTDGFMEPGSVEVILGDGEGGFWSGSDVYELHGFQPYGLAVADLNGDGKPDVVTADYYEGTVSVLLGNGDGTLSYSDSGSSDFATGQSPFAVAVGDFTGDGIPDLVTAGLTVDVLSGLGDGTFTPPIHPPIHHSANGYWSTVRTADFNGDTQLDVVAADPVAGTVSVLLGWGDGTLTPPIDHAAGSASRVGAVGDFNGDGRPDVAAADRGLNAVSVLLNDGAWPDLNTPQLQIRDVTVTEGNTGTVAAVFTVTLSAASDQSVTVAYATGNGTATAGSDYQAASGTLTIPAGQTTGTITVLVNGDRLGEPNEAFFVNLSSPTNAFIGAAQGVGTILDYEPRISINNVSKLEGKNGKTSFDFTVTLAAAYDQPVTMSFRTANGTATTSNGDYVAKTGTLTFNPGETTKTITIEVKGDSRREANETFYLDLFDNTDASVFTKNRGIGTILNDD